MTNENNTIENEPVDIAQAFKMYNQSQREAAEGDMDKGEVGAEAGSSEEEPGLGDGGVSEPEAEENESAPGADIEDNSGTVGGSSNVIEPVDYSPARDKLLKDIQQQAINDVRKEMREQQIEMWSIKDIYEKDEETGRVTFHNPDDPNRPFQSRSEAQAFIDAINKDIENHFRNEVNRKQQELIQNAAPIFQVMEYAPTYNSMNEVEQKVFDSLVEPYAIRNGNGDVIGFNTNLVAAGNVARNIAKNFNVPPAPAENNINKQEQKQGSRPATDMPTGKTKGDIGGEDEPKTIGEALKMYDAMSKKGK